MSMRWIPTAAMLICNTVTGEDRRRTLLLKGNAISLGFGEVAPGSCDRDGLNSLLRY